MNFSNIKNKIIILIIDLYSAVRS